MLYLDIFKKDYVTRTPTGSITHSRDIDYLKRLFVFNDDSIEAYYQGRNFSVKNTNLISRLVEHFPTHLSRDVYSYLEATENTLTYLGKHFQLTSDIEKGSLHPPYFFGNDGDEVIFAGFEPFDAIAFTRNWKSAECIRILKHPRNDCKLLLPLGNDNGCRSGVASIYIDLGKLAIKYREFIRMMASRDKEEILLNKNNFVIKYVLPTCMKSIIDHTLVNKVMDGFYGISETTPKRKHAFKLFEPSTQLQRYVNNTLDLISSKPMDFVQMLRHIKTVFEVDASRLLTLPDFYGNRQILPAVVATRIDHMVFMLDVCKSLDPNRHYVNDWKRFAKRLISDNSLGDFFTYEIERDIKEKLDRILQA